MRRLLIRLFIRNSDQVREPVVRESYGKLAGVVGIVTNLALCISKIIAGSLAGSIAILADGINNLTDAFSSVITLIGFKLAAKPEDREHPFGHARIEYLTGMLISFFIIIVGFNLLISSFKKILNPEPLEYGWSVILILILAIGLKIWQALFYYRTGEEIDSSTLKAAGTDSRNDVIATAAVLISVLLGKYAGIHLDGYMGILVALFIVWSGIALIRETSDPLLGKAPEPELVAEIEARICSQEGILGIHDLEIHSYGPGRIFATVHIEVDAYGDLIKSHDIVDNIEREIGEELGIRLVAHMDPLETKDPATVELNRKIEEILEPLEGVIGIHDLRIVAGYSHSNLIFDVVITPECKLIEQDIREKIERELDRIDRKYYTTITFDRNYVSNNI